MKDLLSRENLLSSMKKIYKYKYFFRWKGNGGEPFLRNEIVVPKYFYLVVFELVCGKETATLRYSPSLTLIVLNQKLRQ